jgi:hypothetical protein
MEGIKHLIECHCYLSIFKKSNNSDIIYHKFPVFSYIDESSKIIQKYVKCNNCEAVHKIYDVGKSEIFAGKDQTDTIPTKDDLSLSLPDKLVTILEKYNKDTADFEHAIHIIKEKQWGTFIVLKRDIIDEMHQVKYLIIEKDKYEIKNATINDTVIF